MNSWYFLHIPKTAGASVSAWLRSNYPGKVFDQVLWSGLLRRDRTEAQTYDLYCGHFYIYLEEYLDKPLRTFTFLRNPIDQAFSQFRHILRAQDHYFHKRVSAHRSFEQYLQDPVTQPLVTNFQVRALSSYFQPWNIWKQARNKTRSPHWLEQHIETADDGLSREERLFIAKTQLLRFETFGITERMADSQMLIAQAIGIKPDSDVPSINVDGPGADKHITPRAWQLASQLLQDDLILYEFALQLFDDRVAAQARKNDIERAVRNNVAQIDAMDRQLVAAKNLLSEREARLAAQETKLTEYNALIKEQELQLIQTRNRIAQLDGHLDSIYLTRSWRMTAPIRKVSSVVWRRRASSESFSVQLTEALRLAIRDNFPTFYLRLVANPLAQSLYRLSSRKQVTGDRRPLLEAAPRTSAEPEPARELWPWPTRIGQVTTRRIFYYVDHTVQCSVNTGIQRVARGLARFLADAGEELILVKWSPKRNCIIRINQQDLVHFSKWNGPSLTAKEKETYPAKDDSSSSLAEMSQTANHSNGHWFIIPEVPYMSGHHSSLLRDILDQARSTKIRCAAIFYDAIPLRRAEHSAVADKHDRYMKDIHRADLVVPISKWSAIDLISHWEHTAFTHLEDYALVRPIMLPTATSRRPRSHSNDRSKLILSVGTIERRKNQSRLLRAFDEFSKSERGADWKLVLVGNLHPNMADELRSAISGNSNISYGGFNSDAELNQLYQDCAFTVFPSEEEGFGLPIVESLDHGKPCICANFGPMAEIAKNGGCLSVDVRKTNDLAQAIANLADDQSMLDQLTADAIARPRRTWQQYTQELLDALDHAEDRDRYIPRVLYWIDHTCSYPANTGIQRVVRALARGLIESGIELVPIKWNRQVEDFELANERDLEHFAKWNGPKVSDWTIPQDASVIRHATWFLVPELVSSPAGPSLADIAQVARDHGLKTAVIFYDAIPWKMPEIYPPQATQAHAKYMDNLSVTDFVLPISQSSGQDLRDYHARNTQTLHLGINNRIQVAPLPGEFLERHRSKTIKKSSNVIRILTVSTIEPRKNHLTLLNAFAIAQKRLKSKITLQLVLVGNEPYPNLADQVRTFISTRSDITWETSANDSRLLELYESCDFTVYPSVEEGFGLPILESLWYARPCICHNASSMAEIGTEGGCLMVDVRDADALADAIYRLATNAKLRKSLAEHATRREFNNWRDYAVNIIQMMDLWDGKFGNKSAIKPVEADIFREAFVNL